ncbi:amino acid adenylation domain protein [Richelia sinica FACHB-800]|uniref:Amino acid adenylation domain protein n=1 Tax=Richelia sinica FACHB-800 TaxID=1357546 RepID=A0A975T9Z3_9NOST|nr:non-ribosomal peptide synthetase [Richelia sinica]MBD2665601.1 amino acid adenylation domain-containing protein [Richelia sinica FACHB-800]QXE24829.1 amino acid adenylation domain protein [Richelia sinica FACHB-800]
MQTKTISGFRLSPQQQRLWNLQQHSSAFCTQASVVITGNLQINILHQALEVIVNHHDILRTSFYRPPGMKNPVMVVNQEISCAWEYLDFSAEAEEDIIAKIPGLFWQGRQKCQSLSPQSILNLFLIKLADDYHILIISLPALCADTRSIKKLIQQISQAYGKCCQGETFSAEYVQYIQFSEWQNQLVTDEDAEIAQAYWQKQAIPCLSGLKLPYEVKSKGGKFVADSYQLAIDPELWEKIDNFAQNYDVKAEIILLACWQVLIWRLTGESEIVIGTASDRCEYAELDHTLGLLATWLPIKTKLTSNYNFLEVLAAVNQNLANAIEWQDYFLPITQGADNFLAFPIGFEWEQLPPTLSTAGVSFAIEQIYSCIEPFKVKLRCTAQNQSLTAELYYDVNYFCGKTIQRLARQLQTVIHSAVIAPQTFISQLPILSQSDRHQLLFTFNQTDKNYSLTQCIHEVFATQAATTPDHIAVVYEHEQLTYGELNRKANQLAHYLQTLGVQPDVVVGLCVERSLEMIIGLLAILKAGGAYLPLDPILPQESLSYRLQDAQAPILLTQHQLAETFSVDVAQVVCIDTDWPTIAQCPDVNPISHTTIDHLVYVLFTSGSTGKPKGVAVEHRQLLNYVQGITQQLNLPDSANFATISTIAADLGNTAIFPALCTGACLHVISHERATNPELLLEYCDRYPLDCLKIVPSHINALLTASQPEKILPQKYLILGGEPLPWNLVEQLQHYAPNCHILNHYGPTEATVGVLTYTLNGELAPDQPETVPLGRPLGNIQIYILDSHLQPVPMGVPGELHIGGESLARGYLHQPELTNQKFIPHPFNPAPGARLYKTGDLARYLPDGNIEFLGRIDQQVKIRGFRIELGEIESVLQQHPAIRETVVTARADESGNQRLIAYFVPHQPNCAVSDIRHFLKQKLPEYMIPGAFVALKKLPLTANGKVDRQALPDPDQIRPELAAIFTPPRTPVEATIAKIWAQVLQIHQVGIYDNFFELGGDSIMTIQIAARANQAGVKITPKQLFENPTVEGLAAVANVCSTSTPPITSTSRTAIDESWLNKLPGLNINEIEDIYELTPIQKGILFHSLYAPEESLYFFQTRFALRGELNVDAFNQAWQQVVERHTILRTSFHWQDLEQPLQVVYKQGKVPLQLQDYRGIDTQQQQLQLKSFLASDRTSGFDLSQVPLMHLTLFRFADDYYEFIWSRHFIIADGWSIPLILDEVIRIYEALCQGQNQQLAPSTPFANYIEWIKQQDLSQAEIFWRRVVSNFHTPTPLTTLYTDNLSHQEEKYDDQQITLSPEITAALYAFARQHQITLNTIIQGAWAFLLSRYSGQEEVVYGCTVSGRPPELAGAESIVGMLVNTLPVKVKVDGNQNLLPWLNQLQAQLLEMRQYEYTSLVEIQAWSQIPRGLSLFDSIVVFENLPTPDSLKPGNRSLHVPDSSNFYKINYPLTIVIIPGSPLVLGINYDFHRVDLNMINGILTHLQILLQNIISHPHICLKDLELITESEQQITSNLAKAAIFDFCDLATPI